MGGSTFRPREVDDIPAEYRGERVTTFVGLQPGASVGETEQIAFTTERMAAHPFR